ncbi:thiamine pyrophosphate-binding protein [Actinoalloteichus hymeniacidonis]|uniref:Acetolactate synthase, large subunit n=1 Tax=Actinoalloteichus hymeniacidonis TaxID=340345 RepID=A0AAC9HR03_9PSEU|nr:thiamine pyrophosphate-binding protein [Actinoalloteichus hymeniacidonis]AOS63396.1 acetolactate synthase, large subunit [Actinoalloteichus hymeniacidonis]MBB5908563.1 acetolactate synthase-1/2/3 large subunit [Actinoalloteichus hymeniacidonis]
MSDFTTATVTTTGGSLVVELLVSLGVRHVFGVPGGQTLAITDAIRDTPEIEFVTARHEGAAAVMADAYGRLTGTPGVCLATTGPGATNLMTGVGGALRDSSPAFVITCNNNGENIHKDDAQNADHVELFKPLTKWSRLVAHGSSIVQAMEEGYVRAMTGNPGPIHLDFARDTIEKPLATVPRIPEVHPLRDWVRQRPQPDAAQLAALAERVLTAERPVIWVGNGVNRSNAGQAVLALAEALNAPVITTFNGIGAVPTTHPLVFGALSRMGTNLSSRVIGDADLVLAVGNSLNAVSTGRWRLALPDIVQIDVDPGTIGRYYGRQTTGIVADATTAMDALRTAIADRAAEPAEKRNPWVETLRTARTEWWQATEIAPRPADALLSPADIVRRLREVAPDDTLLIPDAGNPGVWSYLWDVRQTNSYIKPVGFGNMGFAVPAAVAAAAIDPQRPVLVLVGDGSLGMSLGELETVGRIGGRVCIVVFNDAGYGNIRQEQIVHFDGRTIGVDFGLSDFGLVARGLGVAGERVTHLDVLAKRVGEALAGDRPVLLDVPIDPDVNAWTYPAFRPHDPEDG